jgi:SAM-dependent methyltransferase
MRVATLVSRQENDESHLEFYRRWHNLAGPYFQWQTEQIRSSLGRRVADLGCGLGNLTSLLLDRDYYLGVDNDPEILAELDRNYGKYGMVDTIVANVNCPDIVDQLKHRDIDSILAVNFLAHLEDDTVALQHMVEALPPSGVLYLIAEATPALFGTLDQLDGHYRRYTKNMIRELLCRQGAVLEQLY